MKTNILVAIVFAMSFVSMVAQNNKTKLQQRAKPKSVLKQSPVSNGEVAGIVRYHYNDYQGYKTDIGATVSVIKADDFNSFETFREYEKLAAEKTNYDIMKMDMNKGNGFVLDSHIRSLCGFSEVDESKLKALEEQILPIVSGLGDKTIKMALVDASGT